MRFFRLKLFNIFNLIIFDINMNISGLSNALKKNPVAKFLSSGERIKIRAIVMAGCLASIAATSTGIQFANSQT